MTITVQVRFWGRQIRGEVEDVDRFKSFNGTGDAESQRGKKGDLLKQAG